MMSDTTTQVVCTKARWYHPKHLKHWCVASNISLLLTPFKKVWPLQIIISDQILQQTRDYNAVENQGCVDSAMVACSARLGGGWHGMKAWPDTISPTRWPAMDGIISGSNRFIAH